MTDDKILVVEDEPSIRDIVRRYLVRAGYDVTAVADGQSALDALQADGFELVVLDIMLPEVDGLEITRWMRARGNTPIIMVTARKEESDRILGLEIGADDYVVKPFSPQELVSRVRAVLRRAGSTDQATEEAIEIDGLRIDPRGRSVHVNGDGRKLTAKEFDLLWLFAKHPGQVFSRDQILDRVWGISEFIDASTVTVHVRRLREKIEDDPSSPKRLVTVWGVGYKLAANPFDEASPGT